MIYVIKVYIVVWTQIVLYLNIRLKFINTVIIIPIRKTTVYGLPDILPKSLKLKKFGTYN